MSKSQLYTKTVDLPRPMTGVEIKEAFQKATQKDFREGSTNWDEEKKQITFGAQPDSYPYGLEVLADKSGTHLAETNTYQQLVVKSNDGWGGMVFAVGVDDEKVVSYCQSVIKNFLESVQQAKS